MDALPVALDPLIAFVLAQHADGGPLDHLADAVAVAAQLDEQSDALVGYFVDQARASGASWSQIGAGMGVSKQAAQKRFVSRDGDAPPESTRFSRFTPRARHVVAVAGAITTAAGDAQVSSATVAAALLSEPAGIAARAIRRLDVTDGQMLEALGMVLPGGQYDADPASLRQLRFADDAKVALRASLKAALRMAHNYIGTEHLLVGVLAAPGPTADRLNAIGLTLPLVERALAVEIAQVQLDAQRHAG